MLALKIISGIIIYLISSALTFYFTAQQCQDVFDTFLFSLIWPISIPSWLFIRAGLKVGSKIDDIHTDIWDKAVTRRRAIDIERRLTAGATAEVERDLHWEMH